MRICQIMGGDEEGGLEKHFVDLCSELTNNHEVMAIGHGKYASRVSPAVNYVSVDLTKNRRHPLMLCQVARAIRAFNPDIVHAQANKAAHIVASLRHFIRGKRVVTLHNQGKNLSIYSKFHGAITVSRVELERIPIARKMVIFNGINPGTTFQPWQRQALQKEFSIDVDKPLFAAVGRFVDAKGFDWLLDVWTSVDASLLLIGDGPQRALLTDKIKSLELDGRVRMTGYRNDVLDLISSVDCLIISSRREGFPYLLVEALFVKTPVISTKVSGCKDILPEKYLVEIENTDALTKVIQRACNELTQLKPDYQDTFDFAHKDLTLPAMVEKTLGFYRSVMTT